MGPQRRGPGLTINLGKGGAKKKEQFFMERTSRQKKNARSALHKCARRKRNPKDLGGRRRTKNLCVVNSRLRGRDRRGKSKNQPMDRAWIWYQNHKQAGNPVLLST